MWRRAYRLGLRLRPHGRRTAIHLAGLRLFLCTICSCVGKNEIHEMSSGCWLIRLDNNWWEYWYDSFMWQKRLRVDNFDRTFFHKFVFFWTNFFVNWTTHSVLRKISLELQSSVTETVVVRQIRGNVLIICGVTNECVCTPLNRCGQWCCTNCVGTWLRAKISCGGLCKLPKRSRNFIPACLTAASFNSRQQDLTCSPRRGN